MKNLAVIPARSGSKGLKNKNIKLLLGKPLLAYSIEAAKASGLFEEIYVSTDSEEYAKIAVDYGAKVPFFRSPATATDTASSWEVVRETLNRYEQIGRSFDTVTLLQPTSPLRSSEDIQNAYDLLNTKQANAVVSVCEVDHSPLWCNTLPEDHSLSDFIRKEAKDIPRQSLNTYYRINGGIYMVRVDYLRSGNDIYGSNCTAYIMDKKHSIDIDDELDFQFAEAIMAFH